MIRERLHRNGVTMIEVMVSLLLVSTVLLVSITASANLLRNQTGQDHDHLAEQLAAQWMDEISAMAFRDPVAPGFGLEADETSASNRQSFDDVDDYHNHVSDPLTARDGTTLESFSGWSLTVWVTPCQPDATGITTSGANLDSPLRIVTVITVDPAGQRSDHSMLVSDVPSDLAQVVSYQRWRRLDVTLPSRTITLSTPLRNQPEVVVP